MFLPIAYFNGSFTPLSEIHVAPTDLGIQRGYSVFDFLKLINYENPWADLYMQRLEKSCNLSGIPMPLSKDVIVQTAQALLKKNNLVDGYVKLIVSAGMSSNGFTPSGHSTLLMLAMPISPRDDNIYQAGASLMTSEYRRDLPEIKSTNYLHSANVMRTAKSGVVDVLYYFNEIITETSRCNFFIVKDGNISTPSHDILEGITRRRLLDLKNVNIQCRKIYLSELSEADEAFISSTSKGVMPVTQIGTIAIGNGSVGTTTKNLMNEINRF